MGNMSVWPTDGADGSVATEARWRKMGRLWTRSAVAAGVGGELAPSLAYPNLTIQSGAAWVDGHYTELASNTVLAATANGLAVVRFDPAANTADLVWRDGITTPAQSPTGTWELPIAKTVGSALTDLRGLTQEIARFPNATARSIHLPAPWVGQLSVLDARPGVVSYWSGSAWTDTGRLVQGGYANSITTDAAGRFTITFPVAFGANPIVVANPYELNAVVITVGNTTPSNWQGRALLLSSGAAFVGTISVYWIAQGSYA